MIRSSKATLKFVNRGKLTSLREFIGEYRRVATLFIDLLWDEKTIPALLPKKFTDQITDSWLSARALQAAGKQASGIVRGTKEKQAKRLFIINKLNKEGKLKQARKLQAIYNKNLASKPNINNLEPELDSRFIEVVETPNLKEFDLVINLKSVGSVSGNKLKLSLPVKKHKHFNKLNSKGTLKKSVRLSPNSVSFSFDIPDVPKRTSGITLGLDKGMTDIFVLSDGQSVHADKHGHTLGSICNKLSRKQRGSEGFRRAEKHRDNFIRWSVHQLNLAGVQKVCRENIRHMRKGKKTSRFLQHFNYAELDLVVDRLLEESGVLIERKSPTYSSQRCSACGWVRKSNRKGKQFRCTSCAFTQDADLNAAINLALDLRPISEKERLAHANRKGFYWHVRGQEPIVPVALQPNLWLSIP
jgi:transposase